MKDLSFFFDTFEEADQHASELIASDSLPKAALIWEGGELKCAYYIIRHITDENVRSYRRV